MPEPELAVIIPTRDRREILLESMRRLIEHAAHEQIELIIVDDGSTDGTAESARATSVPAGWRVRVLSQRSMGPAAARNRGVAGSTAPACLFLGDDSLPTAGLVEVHARFHRAHTQPEAALLGHVSPAPPLDQSGFMRWLHEEGVQFGYAALRNGQQAPEASFWTSNVSVKRALFETVGGFDEGFPDAACEDAELGARLARAGMRLTYDAEAAALHFHPTNLSATLKRMERIGRSYRRLVELAPEVAEPRRPSTRHRIKATALTAAMRGGGSRQVRKSAWRFLCDEALRESYWSDEITPPRIGRNLAQLASAEAEANPPAPSAPLAA